MRQSYCSKRKLFDLRKCRHYLILIYSIRSTNYKHSFLCFKILRKLNRISLFSFFDHQDFLSRRILFGQDFNQTFSFFLDYKMMIIIFEWLEIFYFKIFTQSFTIFINGWRKMLIRICNTKDRKHSHKTQVKKTLYNQENFLKKFIFWVDI